MSARCFAALVAAAVLVLVTPALAAAQEVDNWTLPRTSWGDPDLQGLSGFPNAILGPFGVFRE